MLEKTIRAIQFIAKPAVNFATKATAKVAEQAIPRTTEFIKTWQREWDKDASNFKPTIIQPLAKPASSSSKTPAMSASVTSVQAHTLTAIVKNTSVGSN
jgi:hypothetical protein